MIDWTKPLRTSGEKLKARCHGSFISASGNPMRIVTVGTVPDCGERLYGYFENGAFSDRSNHPMDLENIPEEKFVWFNVYKNADEQLFDGGNFYDSKRDAMEGAGLGHPIGRIKVKLEERWDE